MYKFGTIVLVPFPFTDLTLTKLRPALIVSNTSQKEADIIVSFITSQLSSSNLGSFVLRRTDLYFDQTGLKTDSVFRFDKIATLHKKLILGELGALNKKTLKAMKPFFLEVFGFFEI